MSRTRVALVGANGHGLWHRRHLAERVERVEVVALCDPAPIHDAPGAAVPAGAGLFTDYREMLATARPEVVTICTPPHTHLEIASAALVAGCDILLEKPPVLSTAEHATLTTVLARTGRAAQIGFQALGSMALTRLTQALGSGALGAVGGVAAVASWQRSDAYYDRSPWAGRRTLHGRPVLDGALANPLAHAVMQSLVVAQAAGGAAGGTLAVSSVELERYRAREIEVEDTACLRVNLVDAPPVLVAVTLCGEDFIAGDIIVAGTSGRAVLEYPTDRLLLPGDDEAREIPGRRSLLDNLLDHRADPSVDLIAPLSRTLPFTEIVDAITTAPSPVAIDPHRIVRSGRPPQLHRTISGVNAVLRAAARRLELFSELGVEWATTPHRWTANAMQLGVRPGP